MHNLIALIRDRHVLAYCGPACYNATSTKCTCICNGMNHGAGRRAAVQNTRANAKRCAEAFVDAHPWAAAAELRLSLPKAPNKTKLLF
jgi:hypothetical protein